MQVPSLKKYQSGYTLVHMFWCGVSIAIVTLLVGFNYFGLSTKGTVRGLVSTARSESTTAALLPYCIKAFEEAIAADNSKKDAFMKINYWSRDSYVRKAGWATALGTKDPNSKVAEACAKTMGTKYEPKTK